MMTRVVNKSRETRKRESATRIKERFSEKLAKTQPRTKWQTAIKYIKGRPRLPEKLGHRKNGFENCDLSTFDAFLSESAFFTCRSKPGKLCPHFIHVIGLFGVSARVLVK